MDEIKAKALLEKFRLGKLSIREKALLESWYLDLKVDENIDLSEADIISELQQIRSAIPYLAQRPKILRLWPRIAAAAAIFIFISIAGYFVLHRPVAETPKMVQNPTPDVKPGSNNATLTLSNGQKIQLNVKPNGQVAIQGNMAITKSANGQIQYQSIAADLVTTVLNTVSTQRKEQYQVTLSDGTNVWLNASSSITYPTAFIGKDREVAITGEAYFEVAHNAKKPFKVTTQGQTVEVLGTHFNINAYTDEPAIKTTLLEGSVKVSGNNGFKIIKPGQQATFKNNEILISDVNAALAIAWKNGYFKFNKENIESIMRKLSRWYDIDVKFEGPISDDEFSGKISRFKNISEVLKALEYYNTVHFKVEGRRVTVSK